MIKHPLLEKIENMAKSTVFRVVPMAMVYHCKKKDAEEILKFAYWMIDGIQHTCDVYQRVPFEIQPHDEDAETVIIRGRYAFSDTTVVGDPKRIFIDGAFHEIAYGGKAIKLEGTYTLLELESIVNKLKDEEQQ